MKMHAQTAMVTELAEKIEGWMAERDLGMSRLLALTPAEGGRSSETWLISAEGRDGTLQDWVLRIQPRVRQVYQDPAIARQFHVISALADLSGLPIPAAIALEEDAAVLGAPFFLMERAAGEAPPDDYHSEGLLASASPAEREAMWVEGVTMLARLHAVDPANLGFLAYPGGPADDGVEQELSRWESYLGWSGVPRLPIYDEALRWLDDHRPATNGVGFAWGDARPCNLLYQNGRVSALLDWETASLGGAETDLGWWLFYDRMITDAIGIPRLQGLPDEASTIGLWEAASGRRARAIEWQMAFAGYRFAMISERAIRMAIRDGLMPAGREGKGNPAIKLLTKLIGR